MLKIVKQLEQLGANASGQNALQQQISRAELEKLLALNPNICAYDHPVDDEQEDDTDEDKLSIRVA